VQLRQCYLIQGAGTLAFAAAIIYAAPASADDPPTVAGSGCPSGQVGDMATGGDGVAVQCLATEDGDFSWMADTGATDTIAELEKQGYNVRIDRVGSGAFSACKVTDVRNPITTTRTDRSAPGADRSETITINKTVNVSLDCSGG
jgi:hypothetical protein